LYRYTTGQGAEFKVGDHITGGDIFGIVPENNLIQHRIMMPPNAKVGPPAPHLIGTRQHPSSHVDLPEAATLVPVSHVDLPNAATSSPGAAHHPPARPPAAPGSVTPDCDDSN
jgi:hypothetical protein